MQALLPSVSQVSEGFEQELPPSDLLHEDRTSIDTAAVSAAAERPRRIMGSPLGATQEHRPSVYV
jgi:hypothetical protein